MKTVRPYRPETLAVHAGRGIDCASGAITPAIHMSTTFERDPDGGFSRDLIYGRTANPNRTQLEAALSAMEGGAEAACFASGMAAVSAILQALKPGEHVLLPDDIYYGVGAVAESVFARWGLRHSRVDMTDPKQITAAVTSDTRMIWVETPSNPNLAITDLRTVRKIADEHGLLVAVDGTWTTPILQRPIAYGADLVMHSTTKYIAGHSDVTGGVVITRDADLPIFQTIRTIQKEAGAVPSPFDCWLASRGLMSLPVRIRAQCQTAAHLADWLAEHPNVERVLYPGRRDHPGFSVATEQMDHPGAMLSFTVTGGEAAAMRVQAGVDLITRATSLGGTHTLIEHRASIEGEATRAAPGLLRLAVGLEHVEDLKTDLQAALTAA